jgi:signal transduction histidine kinase
VVKGGNTYLVSVTDSGMGITKENLQKLFQPGNVQSTPGTAGETGTGLGLALCKDFARKLGGNLRAKSTYGHGATFTLSLENLSEN